MCQCPELYKARDMKQEIDLQDVEICKELYSCRSLRRGCSEEFLNPLPMVDDRAIEQMPYTIEEFVKLEITTQQIRVKRSGQHSSKPFVSTAPLPSTKTAPSASGIPASKPIVGYRLLPENINLSFKLGNKDVNLDLEKQPNHHDQPIPVFTSGPESSVSTSPISGLKQVGGFYEDKNKTAHFHLQCLSNTSSICTHYRVFGEFYHNSELNYIEPSVQPIDLGEECLIHRVVKPEDIEPYVPDNINTPPPSDNLSKDGSTKDKSGKRKVCGNRCQRRWKRLRGHKNLGDASSDEDFGHAELSGNDLPKSKETKNDGSTGSDRSLNYMSTRNLLTDMEGSSSIENNELSDNAFSNGVSPERDVFAGNGVSRKQVKASRNDVRTENGFPGNDVQTDNVFPEEDVSTSNDLPTDKVPFSNTVRNENKDSAGNIIFKNNKASHETKRIKVSSRSKIRVRSKKQKRRNRHTFKSRKQFKKNTKLVQSASVGVKNTFAEHIIQGVGQPVQIITLKFPEKIRQKDPCATKIIIYHSKEIDNTFDSQMYMRLNDATPTLITGQTTLKGSEVQDDSNTHFVMNKSKTTYQDDNVGHNSESFRSRNSSLFGRGINRRVSSEGDERDNLHLANNTEAGRFDLETSKNYKTTPTYNENPALKATEKVTDNLMNSIVGQNSLFTPEVLNNNKPKNKKSRAKLMNDFKLLRNEKIRMHSKGTKAASNKQQKADEKNHQEKLFSKSIVGLDSKETNKSTQNPGKSQFGNQSFIRAENRKNQTYFGIPPRDSTMQTSNTSVEKDLTTVKNASIYLTNLMDGTFAKSSTGEGKHAKGKRRSSIGNAFAANKHFYPTHKMKGIRHIGTLLDFNKLPSANYGPHGRKKRASGRYTIEVYILIDYSIYNFWLAEENYNDNLALQRIRDYYTFLLHSVDFRFRNMRSSYRLGIRLIGIYVAKSSSELRFLSDNRRCGGGKFCNLNADMALSDMRGWLRKRGIPQHDHVMAFTRDEMSTGYSETSGTAYVNSICTSRSNSVVEERFDFISGTIAAHEIGHALGAVHDGQNNQCSRTPGYIMVSISQAMRRPYHRSPWEFSSCSVREINLILDQLDRSSTPNCLTRSSPTARTFSTNSLTKLGQTFNIDKQCQLITGSKSSHACRSFLENDADICTGLWCQEPGTTRCYLSLPAEGTSCGSNRWCNGYRCVYDSKAPSGLGAGCTFGDSPGVILNGLGCSAVLSRQPNQCQSPSIRKNCCATCNRIGNRGKG